MVIFATVVLVLAGAVLLAATIYTLRTQPPPGAASGDAPVPEIDPLSAGMLLNIRRRAIGAAVVDLVAKGVVAADAQAGPTRYRLVLTHPLPPGSDAARQILVEALFGRRAAVGAHVDVDRSDREQRGRLRDAARSARFVLQYNGMLRGEAPRRALEIASWSMIVLAGAAFAATWTAGVMVLVLAFFTFLLRSRAGWLRTPEGDALARRIADFGARLRRDPALAAREPGWAYLFLGTGRTPWPDARETTTGGDAAIIALPVGVDGERDWLADLGGQFDGGGDAGSSAGLGSDVGDGGGSGDGGGGGGGGD